MIGFDTEDSAIEFAKNYVEWKWDQPVEDEAAAIEEGPETAAHRFEAHMMIDIGFGPQNIPLGQMVSDCVSETVHGDWYQGLLEEAHGRAESILVKEYPDRDLDSIERDIRVKPITD
jgi:hypothetical protein